ncbi:hypothetical protein CYMTET_46891 [Cymbomonas tetramitiformis]|uniref:Isochorismatase-like domain-containing protein n=1 Tax=Cymbomonas tetramitiformis TaxID=36881 RepID=A0AAE0EWN4_9CHLO|nr:hypothetical protein CYMTET_46891 [Cymbomonas tetramitiformis]
MAFRCQVQNLISQDTFLRKSLSSRSPAGSNGRVSSFNGVQSRDLKLAITLPKQSARSKQDVKISCAFTDRTFAAEEAHGGEPIDPETTALVMIEYQNEFATEGGKLHDAVKGVMESNNMLERSVAVCDVARAQGCKILHTPISFNADMSDNPNKGLGILAGCAADQLFVRGTWNAEICEPMTPKEGDLQVVGKTGLDAFPGSNLEELLVENGIKTVALGGFLTNCCVESTMRTAYEKGFNVVTLKDCTAATSEGEQEGATNASYNFFSTPMTSDEFIEAIKGSA